MVGKEGIANGKSAHVFNCVALYYNVPQLLQIWKIQLVTDLGDFLERYKAPQYRCSVMKTCAQNSICTLLVHITDV